LIKPLCWSFVSSPSREVSGASSVEVGREKKGAIADDAAESDADDGESNRVKEVERVLGTSEVVEAGAVVLCPDAIRIGIAESEVRVMRKSC
jgi:hypothetical protein